MSQTTRPPLPTNFQLEVSPNASPNVQRELAPRTQVPPTTQVQSQNTVRRATRQRSARVGRRAARLVSGALFGFNAPITRGIGRGLAGNRRSEDYQNASAMMEAPPSMEAERAQEAQSQSTLNIISETLQRIENTVNTIAEGSARRGSAGEAGGGSEGGGGILGLLSSIIGGMASGGGGIAALGGLVMRTVGRIAKAIFTKIPIIGPLLLVALNIEGAMEEYERNGLGAAVTELIAGIGSDLTFGIIDKDKIKEFINNAMGKIQEWWNAATGKIQEVIENISAAFGRFFTWISDTLSSAFNFFNRRNAELDEEIRRREQLLQEAGRERTSGENNQPGLGRPRVALPEEREAMLQDAFRSRNVRTLEEAERVAGQVAMSNAIAPNTPEYAAFVERARQVVMERSGNTSLAAAGAGMDAEMAFTPTPTQPASTTTSTPAQTPAQPDNANSAEQSAAAPTPAPAPVDQQRNALQRVGDFFLGRNNNSQRSTTTPERAPTNQQTAEANRSRVEGDFNLIRFREVDPEGARDYEQRLSTRTRELVRQRTAQLTPSLDPQRDISQRRAIERQSEADARADVLTSNPDLVERINRSGAGNLTINSQTPPARAAADATNNLPVNEQVPARVDNPNSTVQESATQQPNTPSAESLPQVPPTANMVPTPNAEDRTRALSESAPGPTMIPVPVPQPAPSSSGGGGGGSTSGGGAGPTSASPAQMPPPSHPPRPADLITPQVGGR